jgi:hypothetical protein
MPIDYRILAQSMWTMDLQSDLGPGHSGIGTEIGTKILLFTGTQTTKKMILPIPNLKI